MTLPNTSALRHDVTGAEEISQFSGHWQGAGEPSLPFLGDERSGLAGSVISLRNALSDFHDRGPSRYRKAFQDYIGAYSKYSADPINMPDLPSSRTDQVFTRFAKLEVLNYKGIGLGDIGSDADIYANVRMDGQSSTSTIINDRDSFSFPGSYAPFTWIRAVPTFKTASTPVESITVRVETGNRSSAGTDDDISLNVGSHRFSLDKRLYDDFERGDDDTYAVAIGDATRDGFTLGDIRRISIEKSKDGSGWYLHGVTVTVNGRTILRNRSIDRWLEKSNRVWTAPGFGQDQRTSDVIPVWLQLSEDDFGPQDRGDINVFDRNGALPIAYRLGTTVRQTVTGAARLSGRLPMDNGDRARVTYLLTTIGVKPPPPPVPPPNTPPPTPPPGPPGDADLIVTRVQSNEVTVKNQGTAAAGAFYVRVYNGALVRDTVLVPGLAAGASTAVAYMSNGCDGSWTTVVDYTNVVPESNETNNTWNGVEPFFC
jgi:hypothetical protein